MSKSFTFMAKLVRSFLNTPTSRRASQKRRTRTARPTLEHLETRLVPSTFTVNNTLDDGNPGSLRWAILQANSTTGADTIVFDPLMFSSPQTITLTSALPALTDSALTTLQGPKASLLTIDGTGQYQIFTINSGASALFSGVSISHGYTSDSGGGILNNGTLTVTSCSLSGNTAQYGGGIYNENGSVTVTNCILSGNSVNAMGSGGGIYNDGWLTVTSSTLSGNASTQDGGGGIGNEGMLTVTNCTLSGNFTTQDGDGGGISNSGTLMVMSSILSGNSADSGGGIDNFPSGTLTVMSSTLSGNSAPLGGGGICNTGTMTVTSSALIRNSASGGSGGGGILNEGWGTLTVTSSTLTSNSAGNGGGGIKNRNTLIVTSSTFCDNFTSDGDGGGIYNDGWVSVTSSTLNDNSASNGYHSGGYGGGISNYGLLTVTDSTLSGNSTQFGGGIESSGTLTVTSSTLSDNSASWYGGGIYNINGSVAVTSTIVAGNQAGSGSDISGWTDPGGHRNLIGGDPLLASLGNYGGLTQTMALLPGSPARNGGDPKATDASGHLLTTDQRGFGRPTGDGTKPDIGAFQTQASSVLVFSTPATIVVGTPTTFTVTARDPLGNVVFDYSGTVHLSSSDAQAVLPVQCTLDQGVGTFTATLNSFGSQDLTATDLAHNKITGVSNLIVVNLATPSPPISTSLTFTVNNTLDDGSPGSLRWAILQANGNPGADTIAFDASVFGSPQKITLTSDLPALTDSALTTIQGPGANLLTIDGAGQYQVFLISSGASAWLSGLTISHGYTSDNGGGICNSGSLTVTTSTLSDNTAQSGSGIANDGTATVTTSILSDNSAQYGGGIGNWGTLTLRSCTLSGNSAIEWGGGIINGGTVTVTDSTLSDNSALVGGGISSGGTVTVMDSTLNDNYAQDGAGIDNVGAVTVTDSTLCGNSASSGFGGGIRNYAVLTVRSSTLSGNSALNGGGLYNYAYATVTVTCSTFSNNTAQEGGGIFNSNGSVTVTSTIVAGNQAGSGRDIFGWTDRGGHHNLIGGDPMLAPWASTAVPRRPWPCCPAARLVTAVTPKPRTPVVNR